MPSQPRSRASTAAAVLAQGPPNQPAVEGRGALLTWMKAFPPLGSFDITVDEVSGAGDVAYVRGHYAMTFTPPGAKAPVPAVISAPAST